MMFSEDLFRKALLDGSAQLGLEIKPLALEKMLRFTNLLLEENKRQNLTGLVQPEEVAVKHFLDSLSCLLLPWQSELKCLDLGTGAGFPGIPLALARPRWTFLLVDSRAKRLQFLESALKELEIDNVEVLHSRAEDAGRNPAYRGGFDLVVSRAVAHLPVLLELSIPFLKQSGKFLALKARDAGQELKESELALEELGAKLEQTFPFRLPLQMGKRNLLVFVKAAATPEKYPRKAGIPLKRPLI
ncbi:MAG: 16S rRNA (guanine(527)-N(7))-methyltransferase RsmG [Firmicutes bacterium]|nr:16S rRNA (guanine(527)-N(7))-methyltransferase RsmG [Bacillota bacterium]